MKILLTLVSVLIFLAGGYAGILTYQKLKMYLDLTFRIQKTDDKKDIEEYGIRVANVMSELVPWGLTYLLCVVLFVIVLYNLTT